MPSFRGGSQLIFLVCLSGCDGLQTGCQPLPGQGSGASQEDSPQKPLNWVACEEPGLKGLQCTTLEVPLDHSAPEGPSITLALSRHVHTDPDYRGVILSHPGGPGGSGRFTPKAAPGLPNDIGKKYDWVSLDPRGVGKSSPRLECAKVSPSLAGLTNVPKDDAEIERWKERARAIADQCAFGQGGQLLPFLHSNVLVQDLDAVRAALGVDTVTFYGASYGTYIGQLYASLYPNRINKMILDGVMSPIDDVYELNLDQQRAFQVSTDKFFEWLAKHHARFNLGESFDEVRGAVYDELGRLRAEPEASGVHVEQLFTNALIRAGYSVRTWPAVAFGVSDWILEKDSTVIAELSDADDTNLNSIYLAVMCTDTAWPSWDKTLQDAKISHEAYPLISWHNTWFNSPCVEWKIPARRPAPIQATQVNFPILLTSETHDAATPLSGALDARSIFPTAALVEGSGGSSHSSAIFGSDCTRQAIFDLLDTGTLPPRLAGNQADRQCPPLRPYDFEKPKEGASAFRQEIERSLNPARNTHLEHTIEARLREHSR